MKSSETNCRVGKEWVHVWDGGAWHYVDGFPVKRISVCTRCFARRVETISTKPELHQKGKCYCLDGVFCKGVSTVDVHD